MLKKISLTGILIFSLLLTQIVSYAGDLLGNNTFDDGIGLPWHTAEINPAKMEFKVQSGKLYVKIIEPGENRWDCQLRHTGLRIQSGHEYTVKFTVTADKNCKIFARIGDRFDPYYDDWNLGNKSFESKSLTAGQAWTCNETFTADRTANNCEITFYIGGRDMPAGTTLIFDDIYLEDPLHTPVPTPDIIRKGIRLNQLGYYPGLEKKATLVCDSDTPVDWELRDKSDTKVAYGKTQVFGADIDSGDNVHIIDFSSFTTEGEGYRLIAGKEESHQFDISGDIYKKLKYDALKYYYHQRSGVPIIFQFIDDPMWARPEIHNPDIARSQSFYGWYAYTSTHTINATGGWYDGGSLGKYVVGSGTTVWTMQNMYERGVSSGNMLSYKDGSMNIPESGNSYPDILDEARIQLETMLNMQVPVGFPKEGMVHHEVNSETWYGILNLTGYMDDIRYAKPPTTNATLNLAATAAQASRLWKEYDKEFAEKCLKAAETAWNAAVENPDLYPPNEMHTREWALDNVEDDFYWAACELYVTTGKDKYLDYIKNSEYYLKVPTHLNNGDESAGAASFNPGNTVSLGTLSLTLASNNLPLEDIQTAKENVIAAADFYIDLIKRQGYGVPFAQYNIGEEVIGYPWYSNGLIINNAVIMAYAYDYSADAKYLNGVSESMDYIMGRNPNYKSYVTGYGDNSVQHLNHVFFAHDINPDYPIAPPGILASGPNSGLEDAFVRAAGLVPGKTTPQKCYLDNADSWSTNESSIILNASLAWVAGFLDDVAGDVAITTPTPHQGIKGDVNEDNKVNSTDYSLLRKYILELVELTDSQLYNADGNNDGKVNSSDYSWLRRKILGLL